MARDHLPASDAAAAVAFHALVGGDLDGEAFELSRVGHEQ